MDKVLVSTKGYRMVFTNWRLKKPSNEDIYEANIRGQLHNIKGTSRIWDKCSIFDPSGREVVA